MTGAAKILGINEYDHQTGISMYIKETKPDSYDPTVDDTTPTHTHKCKEDGQSLILIHCST